MSKPLFSIVIPTYNRAHTISRALHSCLRQTCQDFEVIVVDDEKSSDDIEGALAPFDGLRVRLIPHHRGRAAAARNTGIRLAAGQYVALLDADDAFLPTKLECCYERLRSENRTLVYSQNYVDRGVGRYWIKPSRGLRDGENIFDYLFVHKGWIHPSSIVTDATLARRNPFKEDLSFGDDTQFAADLWRQGIHLTMLEAPLTIYEDLYKQDRLSQSPVFLSGDAPEHTSFMEWVETQRPYMSERAYLAYRAFFRSRFMARIAPWEAAQDIRLAYREGALSGRQCFMQIVQTFAPQLYWQCADAVVRYSGRKLEL